MTDRIEAAAEVIAKHDLAAVWLPYDRRAREVLAAADAAALADAPELVTMLLAEAKAWRTDTHDSRLSPVAYSIAKNCDRAAAALTAQAAEIDRLRVSLAKDGNPRLFDLLTAGNDVARADAARIAELEAALADMENRKDDAYVERNRLVAWLARCFPSGIATTAIEGWSPDWHGCVYIDLPTGQVSWHYHDSQAGLFLGLPAYSGVWDGHTTEQKYERLAALWDGFAAKSARRKSEDIARATIGIAGRVEDLEVTVEHLREALKDANGFCRSMHSIATREGRETDWAAFERNLTASLKRQHAIMYPPASALERIAKAATPGPWRQGSKYQNRILAGPVATQVILASTCLPMDEDAPNSKELSDAAHIATFSPPTVLALVAVARAAQPFGFGDPALESILFGSYPDSEPVKFTINAGQMRTLRDALAALKEAT